MHKYSRVRARAALGLPKHFETAITNLQRILRQEPEYTYLKMEEFETKDGQGEWVVSIVWAHHDGDIIENEVAHKSLTSAFYRCADQWLENKRQWNEISSTSIVGSLIPTSSIARLSR